MYFKKKSIEEWRKILEGLKRISTEVSKGKDQVNDGEFLRDSIKSLESIQKGDTSSVKNIEKVINLFEQHHYYEISSGLEMLKGLNCLNLGELSKQVGEIGKKLGLTGIVLYSKDDKDYKDYKERDTFINRGGYKRYFFPEHCYVDEQIDLLSNGENTIDIGLIRDGFIEDARRFDWDQKDYNYRLLWTTNFNFSENQFPPKSDLDRIDFALESKKQFAKILQSLRYHKEQGRVQIILSTPNQIFECQENNYDDWTHTLDGTYYNTIRADGTILNNEGVFWPTTVIYMSGSHLQVKDSNYVVLATNSVKVVQEEKKCATEFVSIIVDPQWFYSFIDYAVKNNLVNAKTIMDFASCVVTETREAITPNYKVEIKPTMVKTLNLIQRPKFEQ